MVLPRIKSTFINVLLSLHFSYLVYTIHSLIQFARPIRVRRTCFFQRTVIEASRPYRQELRPSGLEEDVWQATGKRVNASQDDVILPENFAVPTRRIRVLWLCWLADFARGIEQTVVVRGACNMFDYLIAAFFTSRCKWMLEICCTRGWQTFAIVSY